MTIEHDELDEFVAEEEPEDDILELADSTQPTQTVGTRFDGVFYPYANTDSWGLRKRAQLNAYLKRMDTMFNKKRITEADEHRYRLTSSQILRLVVPTMPEEIVERISPEQHSAILNHFLLKMIERNPLFRTQISSGMDGQK